MGFLYLKKSSKTHGTIFKLFLQILTARFCPISLELKSMVEVCLIWNLTCFEYQIIFEGYLMAVMFEKLFWTFSQLTIAKLSSGWQLKLQLNWDSIITACLPTPDPTPTGIVLISSAAGLKHILQEYVYSSAMFRLKGSPPPEPQLTGTFLG